MSLFGPLSFLYIFKHKNVIKADRLNIKMELLNVLNGVQLEIHSIPDKKRIVKFSSVWDNADYE